MEIGKSLMELAADRSLGGPDNRPPRGAIGGLEMSDPAVPADDGLDIPAFLDRRPGRAAPVMESPEMAATKKSPAPVAAPSPAPPTRRARVPRRPPPPQIPESPKLKKPVKPAVETPAPQHAQHAQRPVRREIGAKSAAQKHPRAGSKLETVIAMLRRPKGATTKEILQATGWPAISVPQIARRAGMRLEKTKEGTETRYRLA